MGSLLAPVLRHELFLPPAVLGNQFLAPLAFQLQGQHGILRRVLHVEHRAVVERRDFQRRMEV